MWLLTLASCGGGSGAPDAAVDATPRQVVMESVPLVVNELVEAVLAGGDGDYARITMMAPTASLDWNIHAHPNGQIVVVHEQFKVMDVDYLFTPESQADWYLLLRNKGLTDMTVQLQVELYGNLTWSGFQ